MTNIINSFKPSRRKKEDFESPIVQAIVDHMTYEGEPKAKRSVWASQALCPRKALHEIENDTTFSSNPIVAMSHVIGNAVEAVFIKALREANMLAYDNVRISIEDDFPEVKLGGIIDAIVKMPNGKLKVIDIKTFGSTYASASRVWHERQVQLYCAATGIHSGSIIGFSRSLAKNNQLQLFDYPVDTSREALVNAMATVAYVFICQEEGVEPYNRNMKKTYCTYCDLKDYCWTNDEPLAEEEGILHDKLFLQALEIGFKIVNTGGLHRLK